MVAGQVGLSGVNVVQSAVRDTKGGIEDVTIPLQDGEVPCVKDLTSNEQSVPPFVQVCQHFMMGFFGFAVQIAFSRWNDTQYNLNTRQRR